MKLRLSGLAAIMILLSVGRAQIEERRIEVPRIGGPRIEVPRIEMPRIQLDPFPSLTLPSIDGPNYAGPYDFQSLMGDLDGSNFLFGNGDIVRFFASAQKLYCQGRLLGARTRLEKTIRNCVRGAPLPGVRLLLRRVDRRILRNAKQHMENHEWGRAQAGLRTLLMGYAQAGIRAEARELIVQADQQVFQGASRAFQAGNWQVAIEGFAAIHFSKHESTADKTEAGRLLTLAYVNRAKQLYHEGLWQEAYCASATVGFAKIRHVDRQQREKYYALEVPALLHWGKEARQKNELREAGDAFNSLRRVAHDPKTRKFAEVNLKQIYPWFDPADHTREPDGADGPFYFGKWSYGQGNLFEARAEFVKALKNPSGSGAQQHEVKERLRRLDQEMLKNARQHMENEEVLAAHEELRTLLDAENGEASLRKEAMALMGPVEEAVLQGATRAMQQGNWEVATEGFSAVWSNPMRSPNSETGRLYARALVNWIRELYFAGQHPVTSGIDNTDHPKNVEWVEASSVISKFPDIRHASIQQRMEAASLLVRWGEEAYRSKVMDSDGDSELAWWLFMTLGRIEKLPAQDHRLADAFRRRMMNTVPSGQVEFPGKTVILDLLSSTDARPFYIHLYSSSRGEWDPKITMDSMVKVNTVKDLLQDKEWKNVLSTMQDVDKIVLTADASKAFSNGRDLAAMFPGKVVWRDPLLDETADNLRSFEKRSFPVNDFKALLFLPINSRQKERMGLQAWSQDQLNQSRDAAESFLDESGIEVPTKPLNRGGPTTWWADTRRNVPLKELFYNTLEHNDGVIILFAHGDSEKLFLQDGTIIDAHEVAKRTFRNRPVVLLFSCEGGKVAEGSAASLSFAEAFKQAGARAVWSFEDPVDVREAVNTANKFLKRVRAGSTLLDAIQHTVLELQKKKGPQTRLKAKLETPTSYVLR